MSETAEIYHVRISEKFHDHGLPIPESIVDVRITTCTICGANNAKDPSKSVLHQISEQACLQKARQAK